MSKRRQRLDVMSKRPRKLGEEPPLLKLGPAHEPLEEEGLRLGEIPRDGAHGVAPKSHERAHALVPVDEHLLHGISTGGPPFVMIVTDLVAS